MTPEDFIAALAPAASASMLTTKIYSSFVLAEAALESAWGTSQLVTQAKNIFGVKSDPSWKGKIFSLRTREFFHGEWVIVPANWRLYDTWEDCISDHAAFLLNNSRYKPAFQTTNVEDFTKAIQACGYATDPAYSTKIINIINAHNLKRFDKGLT